MSSRLATVTRLAPPRLEAWDAVPFAEVQGSLALELEGSLPDLPEYDESVRSRLESTTDAELRIWAARFAQGVTESIGGDRPVSQLLRWTSRRVYQDLERRVQLVRLARPAGRHRVIRPQVRSVHVCQPAPGCAEVSVHIRHGERSRALAARIEHRDNRWVCVALEFA